MTCSRITQVEIYNVLSWAFIVEQITKADRYTELKFLGSNNN